MNDLVVAGALALLALIASVIDLVRTRGQELAAWAVLALSAAILLLLGFGRL